MDIDKKFLGIVEDNLDPKRLNRCKIRVFNLFDGIPTDDIPWAIPHKDTAGQISSLPDKGKVVSVEFENGDIYSPVYRYAEHYNPNLESKLNDLNEQDYISFKSLMFDHITQIYRTESEGLVLDNKYNKIQIEDSDMSFILKDNFGTINIGSDNADQQVILGNNFFNFMDKLMRTLCIQGGDGPYISPVVGVPTIVSPRLTQLYAEYEGLKNTKFLSSNVNIVDNGYVTRQNRIDINQIGDDWNSNIQENNVSSRNESSFKPKRGDKSSTPDGQLTFSEELGSFETTNPQTDIHTPDTNSDIRVLLKVLRNKQYITYTRPYELNIVGVRYQYEGENYTNKFVDKLYVFYKDSDGNWDIENYNISTMPGIRVPINQRKYNSFKNKPMKNIIGKKIPMKKYARYMGRSGVAVLQPAQYVNTFILGTFAKEVALLSQKGPQIIYRDSNWDSREITFSFEEKGNFGIHIHRGFLGGIDVNNWSEGCQVFSNNKQLKRFGELCKRHKQSYGNSFTYTLITSIDFDKALLEVNSEE